MKRFTVIFSPFALDDVQQAVNYYNEQQSGLGKRFAANGFNFLSTYLFYSCWL